MLKLEKIKKTYQTGNEPVQALKGINIAFRDSEFVAILGQSGCGKTTLLNILGGLDQYSSGDLIIDSKSTKKYKDRDWDAYRNHTVGFIFQSYNLIGHQTILANVELALTISGVSRKERRKKAINALKEVGLGDKIDMKPNQLSGGQMQRVAIARALVNNPEIILADEPTGALDSKTSVQIMDILKEIAKNRLVIMVTHNPDLAKDYATRIVQLKDGKIIADSKPFTPKSKQTSTNKLKYTKLSFLTALSLSLNNLMTKKGRTILTAFAGAIGIIGIALIQAISSGMNNYIASVENNAMSSYPIELQSTTFDLSSSITSIPSLDAGQHNRERIYSKNTMIDELKATQVPVVENNLAAFKTYLEENQKQITDAATAIEYQYSTKPIALRKHKEKVITVSPASLEDEDTSVINSEFSATLPGYTTGTTFEWQQLESNQSLIDSQYEVVAGQYPATANEIAIILDEENEIPDFALYLLGLLDYDELEDLLASFRKGEAKNTSRRSFDYSEILGKEYSVIAKYQTLQKVGNVWIDKSDDQNFMRELVAKGLSTKVVGVLRYNQDTIGSGGVGYTKALTEQLIANTANSAVVKEQLANREVNVLTGRKFNDSNNNSVDMNAITGGNIAALSNDQIQALMAQMNTSIPNTYDDVLKFLQYSDLSSPSTISIYPKDFEAKETIQNFIEQYNQQTDKENHVSYTDYIGLLTTSVTSIVNGISIVLTAFVAISLIVSSIMIAIITYISVLERIKEIGVLRALGASKRGVARIFNAETFIEGFISGLIGIGFALLLSIPINSIVSSIAEIDNVAALPWQNAVVLILVSIGLTVLAGLIPARSASKKDPAVVLRSE